MQILVLEDDPETAGHVRDRLMELGHAVEVTADGGHALQLGLANSYDVLVLDRMVPGTDGLKVVEMLRSNGIDTPVLFLTAMGGLGDRVGGLEAGGDDYLVKPFEDAELVARVQALGRRQASPQTSMLSIADLEMNLISRTVRRAGQRIELQPHQFKLLAYMIRNRGEILTRAMLLENVWGFHFDPGTNIVASHVSRLRSKIDKGFGSELIETIPEAGYRIRGD